MQRAAQAVSSFFDTKSSFLDWEQKIFIIVSFYLLSVKVFNFGMVGVQIARVIFAVANALFIWWSLLLESSAKAGGAQDEMRAMRKGIVIRAAGILGLHLIIGLKPPLIMSNGLNLIGILNSAAFAQSRK